jgi:hypothetical protein
MIARRVSAMLALGALAAGCGGDSQCGGGAKSKLSVWAEQERLIGAAFTLTGVRPGGEWRVVVVHEGRVAWRGSARADDHGSLKVKRRLDDYPGADRVAVRAHGPDGATCDAAVRLKADRLSRDL